LLLFLGSCNLALVLVGSSSMLLLLLTSCCCLVCSGSSTITALGCCCSWLLCWFLINMDRGADALVDDDGRLVVALRSRNIDGVLLGWSAVLLPRRLSLGRGWPPLGLGPRSVGWLGWLGLVRWLRWLGLVGGLGWLRARGIRWLWRRRLVSRFGWGWCFVGGLLSWCIVGLFGRLLVLGLGGRQGLIGGSRLGLVDRLGCLGGRRRRGVVDGGLGLVLHLLQHRRLLVDVDWWVAGVDYMGSLLLLLLLGLVCRCWC